MFHTAPAVPLFLYTNQPVKDIAAYLKAGGNKRRGLQEVIPMERQDYEREVLPRDLTDQEVINI